MAARYLVIEFDDEAQADALRAQINAATRKGKKFRVVGLFAKPTKKVCMCIQDVKDYKKGSVKRGGRFGWWVCVECKRPRLGTHHLKNLITPSEVLEPTTYEAMDIREISPQHRTYQMVMGELSVWPEVRRDLPASEESDQVIDAPYEDGQITPYAR